MDVETLYLLVTEAILRADVLAVLGAPGERAAQMDVSLLEERITEVVPASNPEGLVARRGAVRAAIAAGDVQRAGDLADRFAVEDAVTDSLRTELDAMLNEASDIAVAERRALGERFPWAERRYGMEEIERLANVLAEQSEPLPIG